MHDWSGTTGASNDPLCFTMHRLRACHFRGRMGKQQLGILLWSAEAFSLAFLSPEQALF